MNEIKERRKKAIAMIALGIIFIVLTLALFGAAINGKIITSIVLVLIEIIISLLCISYGVFNL